MAKRRTRPAVTRTRMSISTQIQEAARKLGIVALIASDPTGQRAGWIIDMSGRFTDALPLSTGDAADWLLADGFDGSFGRDRAIVHPDRVAAHAAATAAQYDDDHNRAHAVVWADMPAPSWELPALDSVDAMRAWIDAAGLTRVMRINDLGNAVQLNHDRLAGCTFHYCRWSRRWTFAGRTVRPGLMPAVLVEMAADTYGYPDTLIERADKRTPAAAVWTLTGRETFDGPAVVLATGSREHCIREDARRTVDGWVSREVAPTADAGAWHGSDTVRPYSGSAVNHRGRHIRVVPVPGMPGTLRVIIDNVKVYDTPGTAITSGAALTRAVKWMDAAAGITEPAEQPAEPAGRVADPWAGVVDNG